MSNMNRGNINVNLDFVCVKLKKYMPTWELVECGIRCGFETAPDFSSILLCGSSSCYSVD